MSRIINPNQPEPSEAEQVIVALARQVHNLTGAVIQLQRDVKELREHLELDKQKEQPNPENFIGEKL